MASEYGRKNETSPLAAASYDYLAQLYEDYLNGKSDLPQFWCDYFTENKDNFFEVDYPEIRSRFKEYAQSNSQNPSNSTTITPAGNVRSLISAFRDFGHLTASISPLETNESECSLLDISAHDFKDSATNISEYGFYDKVSTVGELVSLLEASYCSNASLETSHLSNVSERNWLYSQVEKVNPYAVADKDTKVKILENLTRAEGIEQYFAVKYVGQKRFSLEGGESVIPGLNIGLEYAVTEHNLSDVVIGMAHRGRLNVMLNTLGMATEEIFKEFEGRADYGNTSGDVKYHLGYSSDLDIADKSLHLTLMFNPSHLEFIAPVVNGSVRARQDLSVIEGKSRASVLPVIIHGDAAVAGQGVVAETFNMSKTPAFDVSGSLHIIINNQVGFTATSDDYMSSDYCSGIAKAVNAPIFHVNGDSPDAVVRCIQIAIDYRMKFGKDVVVDIVCYRRLGHNEADEPVATLPKMYQVIKNHPTTRVQYVNYLKEQGLVTDEEVLQLQNNVKEIMDDGLSLIAGKKNTKTQQRRLQWKKYKDKDWDQVVDTGINLVNLKKFAKQIVNIPEGLTMQRQVA
ncbi:MAG: thiamine pyrophosphate-dependent enzyme [Pseudomonadota bacterium]|nr:thiamine pyrophosphate-dependent enzyme [Pseudomonadota bacterium]